MGSRADGDSSTGIPDDENWPDPAPPGEGHHTDYNHDGVCDHLVTDNIQASPYVSHLLTSKNTEHEGMDSTNMLLLPQQLVPYNKNREEDPKQQFYDEEGKPNNHGAYILLAIQVWMIHGDENHTHRHILFPYTDPEKWNINGLLKSMPTAYPGTISATVLTTRDFRSTTKPDCRCTARMIRHSVSTTTAILSTPRA